MSMSFMIALIPVLLPGLLRLVRVGRTVRRGGRGVVKAGFCEVLPFFCFRSRR